MGRDSMRNANGRQRLVLHVGKVTPVVPPHERRVENGQQVQVSRGDEERLVVAELPGDIQRIARVELDLLVDDLGLSNSCQ